ncbi:MAG: DNA polymerase IV [Candidatus Heimdallarchaeota archaeon]|nr:DNA polymerase IV [Candidatus Heimdallarchaeota archaeon]
MKPQKNDSSQPKFLFHVDLDCFFAAVEMREDPSLQGKPVLVGGNKETKRGVVVTCNYEARKYGVHSGMSALEALTLCPDAVCVSKQYALYGKVSKNIMSILASYSEKFRKASIDEAYLDLTEKVNTEFQGNPILLAQKIKEAIFTAEGITCSIGIGSTVAIAKMATAQNKPNGITHVLSEKLKEFLAPLPVSRVNGIGPKTAKKLKEKHSIETIGDIITLGTKYEMIRKLGGLGNFFYKLISGEGRTTVQPRDSQATKSISKGKTFYGESQNGERLTAEEVLPRLINNVHRRLVNKKFRFKTVTLEVRFQNDLNTTSKSKSFLAANDDKQRITKTSFALLQEIKKMNEPIRKVTVRLSNFMKQDPKQKSIVDYLSC